MKEEEISGNTNWRLIAFLNDFVEKENSKIEDSGKGPQELGFTEEIGEPRKKNQE